jgi:acetyl esterase/lipase
LNITRPKRKANAPIPAVIWIHGGGWHAGNRYSGQYECAYLAQRGYFCASIDYRLSDSYVWPAQIEDCKCAVRYLRSHAKEYGIDPGHIGAWGDSAGGHLAALLGTTAGVAALEGSGGNAATSSKVQAVCEWYGPTDIAQMQAQGSDLNPDDPLSAPALLFGTGGLAKHAAAVQDADPSEHASATSAPTMIVHGDADRTVPVAQSRLLYDALKRVGVPVTLVILPGAGHGDPAFHSEPVMESCCDFFNRYLKPLPPSPPLSVQTVTEPADGKKPPIRNERTGGLANSKL